jgi:hypothetical protein
VPRRQRRAVAVVPRGEVKPMPSAAPCSKICS